MTTMAPNRMMTKLTAISGSLLFVLSFFVFYEFMMNKAAQKMTNSTRWLRCFCSGLKRGVLSVFFPAQAPFGLVLAVQTRKQLRRLKDFCNDFNNLLQSRNSSSYFLHTYSYVCQKSFLKPHYSRAIHPSFPAVRRSTKKKINQPIEIPLFHNRFQCFHPGQSHADIITGSSRTATFSS